MSRTMTQDSLTKFFEGRGFETIDHRSEFNKHFEVMADDPVAQEMRKGISLSVVLGEGIRLSLQGGGPNYSSPRAFAEEYTELEIAVIDNGHFVQLEGDDVLGWVDFDRIVRYAEQFDRRAPVREGGPWCE